VPIRPTIKKIIRGDMLTAGEQALKDKIEEHYRRVESGEQWKSSYVPK
jgi:hypothetical protein